MDPNSTRNGNTKERQLRFKPVARARYIPKNVVVKSEVEDNKDERGLAMLKAFKAEPIKKVKFEKKVEPTTSQQYNVSRSIGDKYQDSAYSYNPKMKLKDYVEPWDYTSHYPVTHPVRRPYSGDPVLLDKEEFGTKRTELYEQPCNAAFELGLMGEQDELTDEPTYIRMQFPLFMPMAKMVQDKETITKEASGESKPPQFHMETCRLNDLPAGHMGKLRVYKSGAVKLHIGDVVYNVSSGLECSFAQELVSINVADRDYCAIDEVSKQAIMIPDFDSILNKL